MNAYAKVKGPTLAPKAAPATAPVFVLEELTDDDIARIANYREFIKKHMPELVELIRELHAEGFIDGWRNVTKCQLIERKQ